MGLEEIEKKIIDIDFLLQEAFLGYKYRKYNGKLYTDDAIIPTKLIKSYYQIKRTDEDFDNMKKSFITHYIKNESKLEGIKDTDEHSLEEQKGIEAMYEYIHSDDINYMFNIYTLKELHQELYKYCPNPYFGGTLRNFPVYLPGTGTDLCEPEFIRERLNELDPEIIKLKQNSEIISKEKNPSELLDYLDKVVVLGCKIIKIHPFGDGNGRTVRGLINKLFEDAGLPPVYIKPNERTEYHKAMNLANNEENYEEIKSFYRYKVCDSIIELDINERIKNKYNDNQPIKVKHLKKDK